MAAALVFDAAPHMQYRHENKTRLEIAQEFGQWLLVQLPAESEIAVLDTQIGAQAAFSPDRGAAKDHVSRLASVANSKSLPETLGEAVKLLKSSSLPRKEIYIFTDLSRGSWPADQAAALQKQIETLGECGLYVVDVGITDPIDYGLGETRLSSEVLSSNGSLEIETRLSCVGRADKRGVELYLLDPDGKPQKRGEQSVAAVVGEVRPVAFRVGGLEPGTHQGVLRLVGEDGLAADDARWFTFEVKPAWRVLLAAPKPAERYARFLGEMLAPEIYRRRGAARFNCDVCDLAALAERPLDGYAAVFLLDPTPLAPAVWKKLSQFAAEGNGVGIFLGRNALPVDSFNDPQAQELLPGKLLRQVPRADGDLHLAPRNFQHPILSAFRNRAGSIPWETLPVFRYWELEEPSSNDASGGTAGLSSSAANTAGSSSGAKNTAGQASSGTQRSAGGGSVVIPYSDGRPALLERPVGRGRALTMTTPISDRPNNKPWNLLLGLDAWPTMILANQMASYLVGGSDKHFNYLAGQTAVLQLDAAQRRQGYLLFLPDGMSISRQAVLDRRELPIDTTNQVGNYRLRSGGQGEVDLGFSVNYAPQQTQLERISEAELSGAFGPAKYRLARTRRQIDRDISAGRVGRELFPSLILIVALVLALESLVSNRFYKE